MTEQTQGNFTQSSTDPIEATSPLPPAANEPVVVEGTLILPATTSGAVYGPQTTQARPSGTNVAGQRPTLVQLLLGSVLVLSDEMGERIVIDEEPPLTDRTPESVFRPVSEFEELLGGEQYRRARYLTLGVAADARKAAERGLTFADNVTDTAGRAFWTVAGPVWNSTLLSPVRRPVQRWRQAGEEQVRHWIASGMQQEMRSRAVATASLTNLVQESVTDLTNNPDIQVLVQEVIQSQSIGLASQLLFEFRERLLSLDIFFQGLFGRAVPEPAPFRDAYVRVIGQRRPQFEHLDVGHSMAGYPAGFVTRLMAFAIDTAVLLLIYAIGSATITGTLNLFGLTSMVSTFLTSGTILGDLTLALIGLASFLLVTGYGTFAWYLTGATIGDTLMGLEVVDLAGGRLTFWRSIRRMIGVYVAAIPLFLGFIWVLFSKDRRGWHDMIGGSFVVYSWPAKPEEEFLHKQVAEEIAEDHQDGY